MTLPNLTRIGGDRTVWNMPASLLIVSAVLLIAVVVVVVLGIRHANTLEEDSPDQ